MQCCSKVFNSLRFWKKENEVESTVKVKIIVEVLSKWQMQFLMTLCIIDRGNGGKNIAGVSVYFIVSLSGIFGFPVILSATTGLSLLWASIIIILILDVSFLMIVLSN